MALHLFAPMIFQHGGHEMILNLRRGRIGIG